MLCAGKTCWSFKITIKYFVYLSVLSICEEMEPLFQIVRDKFSHLAKLIPTNQYYRYGIEVFFSLNHIHNSGSGTVSGMTLDSEIVLCDVFI